MLTGQKHSVGKRPAQAREVARRLKLYSPLYCSVQRDFTLAELRLWWAVLEQTLVDTAHLGRGGSRGAHADSAVQWFLGNACEGVLEALGLEAEYVRGIVRRWLRASGLEAVR